MKKNRIISLFLILSLFALVPLSCSGDMPPVKIDVPDKDKDSGDGDGGEGGGTEKPKTVPDIDKTDLLSLLARAADWQITNHSYSVSGNLHDNGINSWTHGTLYNGMFEWASVAPEPAVYFDWLTGIGEKASWKLPANFTASSYSLYHADELCIGQFYLSMFDKYSREEMYSASKERVDWIMANPPGEDMTAHVKQSWTWCDALYMAPPVYARIASIEGDDSYIAFMDMLYKRCYDHLYDAGEGLFFRDDTYFGKLEANGKKVFWGRGNAWVAAGLVNILRFLPEDHPSRPFYYNLFRKFVPRLVALQNGDGFWHASLLDPASYPSPETSASAMITYAVAYGIRSGVLDHETYVPVLEKCWKALSTVVSDEGKVGYVQPVGQDPKEVTKDMTAVYGVGAFLMAGSETYSLLTELED